MGMFVVEEGTKVRVIREKKEWYPENFAEHVTQHTNVFDKSELVVDPTGIGRKYASVPNDVTVGGAWAQAGWYGFKSRGYYILVPGNKVIYG